MPDLLVKLYELQDNTELYKRLEQEGVRIFRPMTPNKTKVREFVEKTFSRAWADENETAFSKFPISCFIAYDDKQKKIVGFAGYNCTAPDFFGPTGVDPSERGRGIGKALLFKCLEALREEGYGYAIIGGAGPVDFYKKTCGAIEIPGNTEPGIYKDLI